MPIEKRIPDFETHEEAGKWVQVHRDELDDMFAEAMEAGRLQPLSEARQVRRAPEAKNILIRLPVSEIERAKRLAAKKGLRYQTYMKMLLHEALDREESASRGAV